MKILKEIQQNALNKLNYYESQKDKAQIEKFVLINKILSKENALLKLDAETALNILDDIYSSKEVAKKLYLTLVKQSAK